MSGTEGTVDDRSGRGGRPRGQGDDALAEGEWTAVRFAQFPSGTFSSVVPWVSLTRTPSSLFAAFGNIRR